MLGIPARQYSYYWGVPRAVIRGRGRTGIGGMYDCWQVLWENWSRAGHRSSGPYRYRVDDGAAARRCRRGLGWRWHQPWCRGRARARSVRPWLRAREPLLLQPLLLPVRLLRLLPTCLSLLSTGRVLSAPAELLEPLLPLLLRLLSTGRPPALTPEMCR